MYGYEDKLLQNIATWPIWWKLNRAETKTRPTHVIDVALALRNLQTVGPLGQTLSLPGPTTLTHAYLLELFSTLTYNAPSRAPVIPKSIALAIARAGQQAIWWPTLSPDEVERRYVDDVGADADAEFQGDWALLGVVPDEIEKHAIGYVRRYRSAANYTRPILLPLKRAVA